MHICGDLSLCVHGIHGFVHARAHWCGIVGLGIFGGTDLPSLPRPSRAFESFLLHQAHTPPAFPPSTNCKAQK